MRLANTTLCLLLLLSSTVYADDVVPQPARTQTDALNSAPEEPQADDVSPEPPETKADDVTEHPRPRKYLKRHLWHFVTALGTRFADSYYNDQVGPSNDPLLFADPTSVDRWVRNGLADPPATENFVLENRARIGAAITISAAVFCNIGQENAGRWIADDLTGIGELWLFDKGAGGLIKNIVGRQRPEIEFIDDREDLTTAEKEEESSKRTNHQSFYSGATSRQFALMSYADAIVAARVKSRTARVASFIGLYGYAAYVGYSRLEADKHYFTDVAAGAAAGVLMGRVFYNLHHRYDERHQQHDEPTAWDRRRIRLTSVAPVNGGMAVTFSVRL